jgi:hypothetical protein
MEIKVRTRCVEPQPFRGWLPAAEQLYKKDPFLVGGFKAIKTSVRLPYDTLLHYCFMFHII